MEEVVVGSNSLETDTQQDRLRAETISEELTLAIYYIPVSGAWEIVQYKRNSVMYSGSLGYICEKASQLSHDTEYIPRKQDLKT